MCPRRLGTPVVKRWCAGCGKAHNAVQPKHASLYHSPSKPAGPPPPGKQSRRGVFVKRPKGEPGPAPGVRPHRLEDGAAAGGGAATPMSEEQARNSEAKRRRKGKGKAAKWSDERRERVTSKASEEQKLAWQQQQDARDAWRREVRGPAGSSTAL